MPLGALNIIYQRLYPRRSCLETGAHVLPVFLQHSQTLLQKSVKHLKPTVVKLLLDLGARVGTQDLVRRAAQTSIQRDGCVPNENLLFICPNLMPS